MATKLIHSYSIHPVGPALAWDVVYNHVTPSYEPSIYSETTYVFNSSNYDIDGQKLYVGHINDALIAGIQSWLLPKEHEETSFSAVTLQTLDQELGDPDLAPYEIEQQGIDVPQQVSSSIFIGEDPYLGTTKESFTESSYTMETLDQVLLDGTTFMVGCSGIVETSMASGIALDNINDSWTLNMTPSSELTDTHLFKDVRILTVEENNPVLGVTLSGTTLSGVSTDPDAEQVHFGADAWSLHNSYSYTTDAELMEVLKDELGTIPGDEIIDLDENIPLLPVGITATRNAYRADIMHTSEGDFIYDWLIKGTTTVEYGTVPVNPVLSGTEFNGQAEYETGGGTTGTIVIPPNIIIQ